MWPELSFMTRKKGQAMLLVLAIVCFFLGAGLGLRFKILVLVPTIIIMLPITCAAMIMVGHSFWSAALSSIGGALALEVGYLGGAIISFYSPQAPRGGPHEDAGVFPDQAMAEPTRFFAAGEQEEMGDADLKRSPKNGGPLE